MTFNLTLPMVVFAISLLMGWTGFLLGAIKWLLNRQLTTLESRIASAEKKAGEAAEGLQQHRQTVAGSLAEIRLELNKTMICGNHQRMEENDTRLFKRLDQLHGDLRELCGNLKCAINSIDMLNQHHLSGGK